MTYLDNEILTNAKHIHMAFHELYTSQKLTTIVFIVSMNSLAHMMHFAVF